MAELQAHGLSVAAPSGWEGRIFRRAEHGEVNVEVVGAAAPMGEQSFPVVHVATITLPLDVADYGSDVVDDLRRNDALIVLKEFDPADADQPLFERDGMPRKLRPAQFDPAVLQRRLDGQAGFQEFFREADRAFCLYVVLGDYAQRATVVPKINAVLASLVIEPLEPPETVPPEPEDDAASTTTSTVPETVRDTDPTTTSTEPTTTTTAVPPSEPPPEASP